MQTSYHEERRKVSNQNHTLDLYYLEHGPIASNSDTFMTATSSPQKNCWVGYCSVSRWRVTVNFVKRISLLAWSESHSSGSGSVVCIRTASSVAYRVFPRQKDLRAQAPLLLYIHSVSLHIYKVYNVRCNVPWTQSACAIWPYLTFT